MTTAPAPSPSSPIRRTLTKIRKLGDSTTDGTRFAALIMAVLISMGMFHAVNAWVKGHTLNQATPILVAAADDVAVWHATAPADRSGPILAPAPDASVSLHGDPDGTWCVEAALDNRRPGTLAHIRGEAGNTTSPAALGGCRNT